MHDESPEPDLLTPLVTAPSSERSARRNAPSQFEDRIAEFAQHEHARVIATVSLWCGSIDDANDAVADALGAAWERVENGQGIENLAAWVTTVAMNGVRARHRRRSTFRRKAHLVVSDTVDDPTKATTDRIDVHRALETLTERQRNVIALYYGLDLSVAEIAMHDGVSPGTIKATLHQARHLLADRLIVEDPDVS